jgi:hypothetical protein
MMASHVSTGILYAKEDERFQVSILANDVLLGVSPDVARMIATQLIMNADLVDVANKHDTSEVSDVVT